MATLTKVTMNLTQQDIERTEALRARYHSRSSAEVISTALGIMHYLSDEVSRGKEIRLRDKNGNEDKLVIPGLYK